MEKESSHQATAEWRGKQILTLADLLAPNLRALCIGINPSPTSVAVGHYYQGRLGQQFFKRLANAGVVEFDQKGWQDNQAFHQGVGFTDLVKRPTSRADELTNEEFAHGLPLLVKKVGKYKPELLIFSFKQAAQKVIGHFQGNGLIHGILLENVPIFVMPGPYAKREDVTRALAELQELWGS